MSEKMPVERAAEILDPKHRERYESLSVVEEACSMGHDALLLRIPRSPYKKRLFLSELRFQRLPVWLF